MSNAPQDFINLWQYGKLLVVHRSKSRFPNRCLKTNDEIFGRHTKVKLTRPQRPGEEPLSVSLYVPLNGRWRRRSKRLVGMLVLWIGLCLFFGGGIYAVVDLESNAGVIASMSGTMLMILSPLVLAFESIGGLRLKSIDGEFYRIERVSPRFLEGLPQFDGESQSTEEFDAAHGGSARRTPTGVTTRGSCLVAGLPAVGGVGMLAFFVFKGMRAGGGGRVMEGGGLMILLFGAIALAIGFVCYVTFRVFKNFFE